MTDQYPIGPIASGIRSTFGATFAAYVLFVVGTLLGGWVAMDFQWWDWRIVTFVAFLIPYLFVLTVAHPVLALFTIPLVVAAWFTCIYAESPKLRIGMLALIFAVAFGDTYYMLATDG